MSNISPTLRVVLGLYLAAFWLFSASTGFLYFEDSKTYYNGDPYVPLLTESFNIYPVSAALISIFNLVATYKLVSSSRSLISIFLLSPYSILLISNVTKEAFIFAGLVFFFFLSVRFYERRWLSVGAKAVGLVSFIVRPIYFCLMFVGPRRVIFLVILGGVAAVLEPQRISDIVLLASERMEGRAAVVHTGRDFFNYLCVYEKVRVSDFAKCIVPVFFLFPIHESTLSFDYLPYLIFQIPVLLVCIKLAVQPNFNNYVILIYSIVLYIYIFLISPTFGAFIRYYHPVIWFAGFYAYSAQAPLNISAGSARTPSSLPARGRGR